MYGANVIIFEGILVFHSTEILKLLDMKIFVDTDADIRLARRLKRFVCITKINYNYLYQKDLINVTLFDYIEIFHNVAETCAESLSSI